MNPEDYEKKEARERQRADFLAYCEENDLDPEDEESMEEYKEVMAESSWEGMDPDDVAGWTDNMNKD